MDIKSTEEGKGGVVSWVILAFISLVLLTIFYWFAWRPTQIKKQCFRTAGWTAEYYECLMNNGIDFKLQ